MIHQNRARAGSFGEDAPRYDRARPRYPEGLFELLAPSPCRAVDIGCGTGIVSRALLAQGCEVLGVEPDTRMAEVAHRSGVAVEVSTFEEWDPGARSFELLTAGQSWHWVQPEAGAAKVADTLGSGGRFALFWNDPAYYGEVDQGFMEVYGKHAPHLRKASNVLGTNRRFNSDLRRPFEATGAFTDFGSLSFRWQRDYSTAEWLDQLATHSTHRVLPEAQLAALSEAVGELIDSLGGSIAVDYETSGLTAVRR